MLFLSFLHVQVLLHILRAIAIIHKVLHTHFFTHKIILPFLMYEIFLFDTWDSRQNCVVKDRLTWNNQPPYLWILWHLFIESSEITMCNVMVLLALRNHHKSIVNCLCFCLLTIVTTDSIQYFSKHDVFSEELCKSVITACKKCLITFTICWNFPLLFNYTP